MIDIHLLEQFHTFAECGTLSAAAEKLHTSQPALTRAMKKLEEDLGVDLFIRSKNQLRLNETGLHAAKYARDVLEADADFESKVKAYDKSLHTISIGFCAPVPQIVLTPMLNTIFEGMTISADMTDDVHFVKRLKKHEYHLAVLHEDPKDDDIYVKKCGHEDLSISLMPGDPLAFYPEVHLSDLDGKTILLLTQIGFWINFHNNKTPNTNYLLQIDSDSFFELSQNSNYPSFSSSYYTSRGFETKGKITVPIADPECHTDYFLACLSSEKKRYSALFDRITEKTIN
ncbi:MAG: LysR family transcriptional regulator [Clostridiales bacterium]|nr:LysR family transcriptional regulator [Clostridiales bacterium]MBR5040765.1 LysR family transcriptional regulator [Clostridiales bacterium]